MPRRKRSTGKATWPGRKQVFRRLDAEGRMAGDVLTVEGTSEAGAPLVQPLMRAGKRIGAAEPLSAARERAAGELGRLPVHLRRLETTPAYRVEISPALRALAGEVDERTGAAALRTPAR